MQNNLSGMDAKCAKNKELFEPLLSNNRWRKIARNKWKNRWKTDGKLKKWQTSLKKIIQFWPRVFIKSRNFVKIMSQLSPLILQTLMWRCGQKYAKIWCGFCPIRHHRRLKKIYQNYLFSCHFQCYYNLFCSRFPSNN